MAAPEVDSFKVAQITAATQPYNREIARAIAGQRRLFHHVPDVLTPTGRKIRRFATHAQTRSEEVGRHIDHFRAMPEKNIIKSFEAKILDRIKSKNQYSDLCFQLTDSFPISQDEKYEEFSRLLQQKTEKTFEESMMLVIYAAELALISGEAITVPLSAREREKGVYDLNEVKSHIIGAYEVLGFSYNGPIEDKPIQKLNGKYKASFGLEAEIKYNPNRDDVFSEDSQNIPYTEITISKPRQPDKHLYALPITTGWGEF
jgi:hypothetical protein